MTSIIPTAVLRAAVLSAFDRGRYQVHFGTTPAGDDIAVVPASIVLDLAERDDDLLGAEPFELFSQGEEAELRREVSLAMHGLVSREVAEKLAGMDLSRFYGADDHGPAVPAQDSRSLGEILAQSIEEGPSVYEFALQDYWAASDEAVFEHLADIELHHAPDLDAAEAADWVHVYDRVTRERRTLKRPAEDKIVKGLADVAEDLRGHPIAMAWAQGKSDALSDAVEAVLGDDLAMRRAVVEAGYSSLEDYVEAPVPAPALLRGDVVRGAKGVGRIVSRIFNDGSFGYRVLGESEDRSSEKDEVFTFVGRPDADGWMKWCGGENPVGEAMVEYLMADAGYGRSFRASGLRWSWPMEWPRGGDIIRFRLVDMPSLPSDT